MSKLPTEHTIDYVEIYSPMSKALAYWHAQALGFTIAACADHETGKTNISSYVLRSNEVTLVITSTYPTAQSAPDNEISSYVNQHYCGIKRFALRVPSVSEAFDAAVAGGAIPTRYPVVLEDGDGRLEEAAIRLYDSSEIVFINRDDYRGAFKPGYAARQPSKNARQPLLLNVDHIASELRINEIGYWTNYLGRTIGTSLVQSIQRSEENRTGMILNINQSPDRNLTLVMAEPESPAQKSKIQQNIDKFGSGIHHLAFATDDILAAIQDFSARDVEFVHFPSSYYDLLRSNPEFADMDVDALQEQGILIDKEGDTCLFQKFIRPISERPFFLYEIVQRVNGYNGFALKNINVLKKAEELQIMKTAAG